MPLISVRTVVVRTRTLDFDTRALYTRVGNYMVSSTQRKIRSGSFVPNAPLTVAVKQNNKPLRDTGLLMASISYRTGTDSVRIGTNRAGAALNHFGGSQRPKKGTWLWIPAGKETRSLLGRYGTVSNVVSSLKRDGYNTWFRRGKGGCVCFFAKKGKTGKVRLIFILKKRVKIPARPFLRFDDNDRRIIGEMALRIVSRGNQS